MNKRDLLKALESVGDDVELVIRAGGITLFPVRELEVARATYHSTYGIYRQVYDGGDFTEEQSAKLQTVILIRGY